MVAWHRAASLVARVSPGLDDRCTIWVLPLTLSARTGQGRLLKPASTGCCSFSSAMSPGHVSLAMLNSQTTDVPSSPLLRRPRGRGHLGAQMCIGWSWPSESFYSSPEVSDSPLEVESKSWQYGLISITCWLLLLLLLSHFSHARLCATSETAAHQVLLSLGFSRQEYCSGLPFPSPNMLNKQHLFLFSPSCHFPCLH